MFLRPVLGAGIQQKLYSSIKSSRTLRPIIKIGKDTFQITINVHHYKKDEIRVKAHPEYVVIEGKQEKNTEQGHVLRQFIRKFKVPEGCIPSNVRCTLSSEGMLTVTAPRSFKDSSTPAEAVYIPVSYGGTDETDGKVEPTEPPKPTTLQDYCGNFPKVKPKKKNHN